VLQASGAIAVLARPGLRAVAVKALAPVVRVLDARELKILLPIRALLGKRRVAEADFHPANSVVLAQTCLPHIAEIFVACHGTAAERAVLDGLQESLLAAGFDARAYEVAHVVL